MDIPASLTRSLARAAYLNVAAFGEPVMIHERAPAQPGGFIDHGPVNGFPSSFRREELIPGGPIEQGDVRLIFAKANWPPALTRRLGLGDRVTWRGDLYAVMNQDDATRSVSGEQFGVDLHLRGGAG